jgi:probable rRNA maturation factor
MINLDIAASYRNLIRSGFLEETVRAVFLHQGVTQPVDLTLKVTGDARLRELNSKFRNIDEPTDVLAFPAGHIDPDTDSTYLGDIVISYPQALAQARTAGHSIESELSLLTVHGVLHLLDYDHLQPEDKARMWGVQAEILTTLGFSVASPD